MGWYPNNLPKLDSLMDEMPNMYVEIGAVIAELGRQPHTAKRFFEKRQDRILLEKTHGCLLSMRLILEY
jgi:cytochrome bd-type quinol oxidase subunit 1